MAGILEQENFDNYAIGTVGNTTTFFNGGGGTNPAQATIQNSRSGSAIGIGKYLNYKRTAATNGFILRDLTGTPVTTARRYRWYQTIITAPSASTATVYLASGGTNRLQVFVSTTRTVQLRNVTTPVGSASSALVLGRRYRFEWLDNPAASQQQLVIYEPDEVTQFYDSSLVAAPSAANDRTGLRLGNAVSGTLEIDYAWFVESDMTVEIGPVGNVGLGFEVG